MHPPRDSYVMSIDNDKFVYSTIKKIIHFPLKRFELHMGVWYKLYKYHLLVLIIL